MQVFNAYCIDNGASVYLLRHPLNPKMKVVLENIEFLNDTLQILKKVEDQNSNTVDIFFQKNLQ